jgi:hypothetical protein
MGKKQWAIVFVVFGIAMLITGAGYMMNQTVTEGIGRIAAGIFLIILAVIYWKKAD